MRVCVSSPPQPPQQQQQIKTHAVSQFSLKKQYKLEVVFINITLDTEGVLNKDVESQHVSALKCPVCSTPSENTLLIGFRYLQNDLFNGITTRIMILFMREAIQALGLADNTFSALWQLMLCYKGR